MHQTLSLIGCQGLMVTIPIVSRCDFWLEININSPTLNGGIKIVFVWGEISVGGITLHPLYSYISA